MSNLWLFDADNSSPSLEQEERVFSVAELNRLVRSVLEAQWPNISVRGELADVKRHRSGHVYFTLNDAAESAQLRCVMFRSDVALTKATFADGECVRLTGALTLYEARGSFQLVARTAAPEGAGDLRAEFERLRRKLQTEGLIDPARRRPLPRIPTTVGIVSSIDGAALVDILFVASKRFAPRFVVAPCTVQGKFAPASIVSALASIQRLAELDVVIVTRGGGSAEDLAAFNDEQVARAIAACRVPVVSAVGHEVDVSIADLVADLRAATPSNAAELVVPDRNALMQALNSETRALQRAMDGLVGRSRLRLERLCKLLEDPRRSLAGVQAKLQRSHAQLVQCIRLTIGRHRQTVVELHHKLLQHDVRRGLARDRASLQQLQTRLQSCAESQLAARRSHLHRLLAQCRALSPLGILARGYALAMHEKTGRALTDAATVAIGDTVSIRLHKGTVQTRAEKKL